MGAAQAIHLLEEAQAGPARMLTASARSAHLDSGSSKCLSEPGSQGVGSCVKGSLKSTLRAPPSVGPPEGAGSSWPYQEQ